MSVNGKGHANNSMYRLFGFLLGATTAGAGMYYYVIDEYRVSNELLTEDIYVRLLLPQILRLVDSYPLYP